MGSPLLTQIELNGENSSPIIKYLKKRSSLYSKKLISGSDLRSEAGKFYYDEGISASTARYYGNEVTLSSIVKDITANPIKVDLQREQPNFE